MLRFGSRGLENLKFFGPDEVQDGSVVRAQMVIREPHYWGDSTRGSISQLIGSLLSSLQFKSNCIQRELKKKMSNTDRL